MSYLLTENEKETLFETGFCVLHRDRENLYVGEIITVRSWLSFDDFCEESLYEYVKVRVAALQTEERPYNGRCIIIVQLVQK